MPWSLGLVLDVLPGGDLKKIQVIMKHDPFEDMEESM